jgi:predicted lipoprotein
MKKPIKYIIIALILGISVYNSIYIKKLDEVKAEKTNATFNAKTYASDFINSKVETLSSLNASKFLNDIETNVTQYSEANGNKLGISNNYYFIIDGDAKVESVEEENVVISLLDNNQKLKIATDFIFGNDIREGANMANIGDFQNTMDYNNISVKLNNMVRETIIPPFIKKVQQGDIIYFKGAVKVNTKKTNLDDLRVMPLILKIKN